jgi:antitoxin CptB
MTPKEEARLKRLKIRCWRRGIKEMDLLLGPYADALLEGRTQTDLDAFEALIAEGDQQLYRWLSGAEAGPEGHGPALDAVRRFHGIAA